MSRTADPGCEPCDLNRLKSSLPAELYYTDSACRDELDRIWYRNWIYLCRHDSVADVGDYRLFTIGTQKLILTRDADRRLHAFHNCCPHRGSLLCENESGRFPGQHIVCPYHRWTYALDGALQATPFLQAGDSIKDIGLFEVALQEWGGNVYVNLAADQAGDFAGAADARLDLLQNWPLADLLTAHVEEYVLACNWKVFWENFVECYHCPGTHPGLCQWVPLYGHSHTGLTAALAAAGVQAGLRPGARSWTVDGKSHWPAFPALSDAEKQAGQTFLTLLPTMFMVAHLDYLRQVSIVPLGPERLAVRSEWLFSAEAVNAVDFDSSPAVDFVRQLLQEDARVCELNQQGLRALAFDRGRLVPQEQDVYAFHEWYRGQMA